MHLLNLIFYTRLFLQHKRGQIDLYTLNMTKESLFEACFREDTEAKNRTELFRIIEELAHSSLEICRCIVFDHFDKIVEVGGFHLVSACLGNSEFLTLEIDDELKVQIVSKILGTLVGFNDDSKMIKLVCKVLEKVNNSYRCDD